MMPSILPSGDQVLDDDDDTTTTERKGGRGRGGRENLATVHYRSAMTFLRLGVGAGAGARPGRGGVV